MTGLVERLRGAAGILENHDDPLDGLVNEAAARIEALEAALRKIADYSPDWFAQEVSRATLSTEGLTTGGGA